MRDFRITQGRVIHYGPRRSLLALTAEAGRDQIRGVGEAILEGSADTVEFVIGQLLSLAVGKSIWASEEIEMEMRAGSFYPPGLLGLSALSALDQAMWDLRGKAADVPVWQILGGCFQPKVPLYFHAQFGNQSPGSITEAKALAEEARASADSALANGVKLVKTVAFGPVGPVPTQKQLRLQVAYLRELQVLLGSDVDVAVDVHGRYTYPGALLLLEALADVPLSFVEEPLHPHDRLSYSQLVERSPFPIAAGERLGELWEFRQALDSGISILQPDLAHCGGITAGLRIGALARSAGAQVALHNPLGVINLASSLHLVASQSNFMTQETVDLGDTLLEAPLSMQDGCVDVREQLCGPGLGLRINPEEVPERGGEDWRTPVWHDALDVIRPW